MLYGITGASGTGKTTLAKAVAEDLGILYQSASITASARKHGFDPVKPLDLEGRVRLQYLLLNDFTGMLGETERPMIVDRTPIDMLAYLLGEFSMRSHAEVPKHVLEQVDRYVDLCMQVTERYFDFVFIVGQLGLYEEVETRPAANVAYQRHTQLIMEGALSIMGDDINQARVMTTDLEERKTAVHDIIVARMDTIEVERRSSPHVH